MQMDPFLSPYIKLKSKWSKDLHIKPDTLNLIEEKVGKRLEHMGTGEIFQNRTPMVHVLSSTMDKWDCNKIEQLLLDKGHLSIGQTGNPQIGKSISKRHNELKKLYSREPNNPIKNGVQSYTKNFHLRNNKWLSIT